MTSPSETDAERCPACGRRTFHPFIDPKSGLFGRCARKACGYQQDMEDTDESGY